MRKPGICSMCRLLDEEANHLFIGCSFATEVWSGVMKVWSGGVMNLLKLDRLGTLNTLENCFVTWSKDMPEHHGVVVVLGCSNGRDKW